MIFFKFYSPAEGTLYILVNLPGIFYPCCLLISLQLTQLRSCPLSNKQRHFKSFTWSFPPPCPEICGPACKTCYPVDHYSGLTAELLSIFLKTTLVRPILVIPECQTHTHQHTKYADVSPLLFVIDQTSHPTKACLFSVTSDPTLGPEGCLCRGNRCL